MQYQGVKVFSATKAGERENLGERLAEWMDANSDLIVVDTAVRQSSDHDFHCLTITVFYNRTGGGSRSV